MKEIKNGETVHTENYGFAVVVDVDHGPLTLKVRVNRDSAQQFDALVYCDEVRPTTIRERSALAMGGHFGGLSGK